MVTHSNILTWRITWTEEPGSHLQSMGLQRVGQDWASEHTIYIWKHVSANISENAFFLCPIIDHTSKLLFLASFLPCFNFLGGSKKKILSSASDGNLQFSSVQFSPSVMFDSLQPHESQHARTPCPSPTPGIYSDSHPSVSDAIQPSHPLLSPSPPAPNPSQHQSLFQWVNSSHEVAEIREFQLQHQSLQWTSRTDLL